MTVTNNAVDTTLSGQTGSASFVGSTSPTLVTPLLGTPTSGVLTNCTGLPLTTGVTGNLPVTNLDSGSSAGSTTFWRGDGTWAVPAGAGASSITGTANQVLANGTSGTPETGAVTLTTPQDIGISSSPTFVLTNCTGLPLTTGVTGNLAVTHLNSGTSAGSTTFWRGDGVWASAAAGSGGLINVQIFKTSGTYTPTAGMANCIIVCVGGGGAGGGTPASAGSATAGGGGSGGFSQSYVNSGTIGASQTVTIGGGGTGVANGNGGSGGSTSVGSIVIANGGTGGTAAVGTALISFGAAGATAATGDIAFPGTSGLWGSLITNGSFNGAVSGAGGNSYFGNGAAAVGTLSSSTSVAGTSATANTGGGGSGSAGVTPSSTQAGGNGGSGICIIYEYS